MFMLPVAILHLLAQLEFLTHSELNCRRNALPPLAIIVIPLLSNPPDNLHSMLELVNLHKSLDNLLFRSPGYRVQIGKEIWERFSQFFVFDHPVYDILETHLHALLDVSSNIFVEC